MELQGIQSISLADYESYRSRQVSLATVKPDTDYHLVGLVNSLSADMDAALIETYNARVHPSETGRIVLNAMLLRDEMDHGVRPFKAFEETDNGFLTLRPFQTGGAQLYGTQFGRLQIMAGYLIDRAEVDAELAETPEYLATHSDAYDPRPRTGLVSVQRG